VPQLICGESKGNRREEAKRRRLLFKVSFERMIHVGDAGTHRVEGFERSDKSTGRKNLDFDAPNRAGLLARRTFGPVGHHLQLSDPLRDRGRWKSECRAGGQ
jgi:hypothetical protein